NAVSPGHFRAIGVDLMSGRDFGSGDVATSPKVAIVNEAFMRKFTYGKNPVGMHMATGRGDTIPLDIQIIGLVRDSKYSSVKRDIPPVFFRPHAQQRREGGMTFYVRTDGDPSSILRAIRPLMQKIDPQLPVESLRTMPEEIRRNTFEDRMISTLSAAFAVLATLLAAIGLYGVLAYSVAQRTREIGVRMALGADSGRVRAMVLRQVSATMLVGSGIGLAGALGVGRAARSLLYGLEGHDPVVFALAVVLLMLVALGAVYVPARRASLVDPVRALRYE